VLTGPYSGSTDAPVSSVAAACCTVASCAVQLDSPAACSAPDSFFPTLAFVVFVMFYRRVGRRRGLLRERLIVPVRRCFVRRRCRGRRLGPDPAPLAGGECLSRLV
jgi:hypothetical protein